MSNKGGLLKGSEVYFVRGEVWGSEVYFVRGEVLDDESPISAN